MMAMVGARPIRSRPLLVRAFSFLFLSRTCAALLRAACPEAQGGDLSCVCVRVWPWVVGTR